MPRRRLTALLGPLVLIAATVLTVAEPAVAEPAVPDLTLADPAPADPAVADPALAEPAVPDLTVAATTTGAGTAPTARAVAGPGWRVRDRSVRIPAAEVVGGAAVRGPVRTAQVLDDGGHPRIVTRTVTGRSAAEAVVRDAQADPATLAIELDTRVSVAGPPPADDTYRSDQWALDALRAEGAWAASGSGAGVTVAIIDTGIDAGVTDLTAHVVPGTDLTGDGASADGRVDPHGHGTHVAGIIGAITGDAHGVAGLAPAASLMPVRALNASGSAMMSTIAAGVVWAADHGASVINLSLGGTSNSSTLATAIDYAREQGVTVVAAAGNDAAPCTAGAPTHCGNPVFYPAANAGVIAVGAVDAELERTSFSEYGSFVDLTAPGWWILSTYPSALSASQRAWMSGTSMAAPYVTASAALLLGEHPSLTPDEVEALLETTATDRGEQGRDDEYGYGFVDPLGALEAAASGAPPSLPDAGDGPEDGAGPVTSELILLSGSRTVAHGARVTLAATLTADGDPLGGADVSWCVHPTGRSTTCRTRSTDDDGRTTFTLQPERTSVVRVRYAGSDSATAAASGTVTIRVRATATARAPGRRALVVAVEPGGRRAVTLQRHHAGRWRTEARRTTDPDGGVTFPRLVRGGLYRAVVAAADGTLGTRTPARRVR